MDANMNKRWMAEIYYQKWPVSAAFEELEELQAIVERGRLERYRKDRGPPIAASPVVPGIPKYGMASE
jgi:hypothetical protein